MAEAIQGFAWHLHHNVLVESCWDYGERQNVIRRGKPHSEMSLRLRLFQMVRGELPSQVVEARAAYEQAWAAYKQAGQVCEQAGQVCDQVLAENMPAILTLHAQECPDCPWDGRTIFPTQEVSNG